MFLHRSVILFTRARCTPPGQTPLLGRHPPGRHPTRQTPPPGRHPTLRRHPSRQTPPGQIPPTLSPMGHCRRRYTSYWNAFLFYSENTFSPCNPAASFISEVTKITMFVSFLDRQRNPIFKLEALLLQ